MTERVDERESGDFFLNVLRKLFDPFLDLAYFRENRPVFFYEPFDQWFVFGYDHVANLFPDPDRFDISRKPGRYLSFGFGPHGCLGALLAKEETRIALETLFRRMPDIKLDESKEIEWHRNAANRGCAVLPLTFGVPRTGAPG